MKIRWIAVVVLTFAVGLLLRADLGATDKKKGEPAKKKKEQFKEVIVNGELINVDLLDKATNSYSKSFTYKMEKDKSYQIDLRTNAFQPYLRLENSTGTQVGVGNGMPASIFYKPTKDEDYQIIVTSQGNGVGKFILSIRDASASLVFSVTDKLAENDKVYVQNRKHKMFLVEMEEGKTYQIDMKSTNLDSYLYFESPDGKLLAQDDDGGGYPDARIIHKATKTGKYRVIASHFDGKLGEFTITVRHTTGEAPPNPPADGGKLKLRNKIKLRDKN
jgi:hypothetical protein